MSSDYDVEAVEGAVETAEADDEKSGKKASGRPPKDQEMLRAMTFLGLTTLTSLDPKSKEGKAKIADIRGSYVKLTGMIEVMASSAKDRVETLLNAVEIALGKAVKDFKGKSDLTLKGMPWIGSKSPTELIETIDRNLHANARILEFLHLNTVQHLLVDQSLQHQRGVAEGLLAKRLLDIPETLVAMATKLHLLGIRASAVNGLSHDDYQVIVSAINNSEGRGLSLVDLAPLSRPSNRTPDVVVAQLVVESRTIDEAGEAGRTEVAEPYVPDALAPVALDYPAEWLDISKPIPAGFWDSIGDSPLPYRWEYRQSRDDEERAVAGMPWPLADEWVRLQERDAMFRNGSEDVEFVMDALYEFIRVYISISMNIPEADVDPNWVKAWIYLLWARHHPEMAEETYGKEYGTYFAGVRLMVLSMGQGDVRELVPVLS